MFDYAAVFDRGLRYDDFLAGYASDADRAKWQTVLDKTELTEAQKIRVGCFRRAMPVVCLAGAWCGDCVSQCPILHTIALNSPLVDLRFFDRDAFPDLAAELQICGAPRVPSVLFLAEDFLPVGRYGDKTLAKYRKLESELSGAACSLGYTEPPDLHADVTAEWVDQFERNQLILRTSGRLRKKHGD